MSGSRGGETGSTRGLFALVIGLGVFIVVGFAVVVATLAHRMLAPPHGPAMIAATTLGEPPGTHVGALVATGDRLAVLLQGGGAADRIVLLDPHDGARVGAIAISGPAGPSVPQR